jgi:hypothetical protein
MKMQYRYFILSEQIFLSPNFQGKIDRAAYSFPDVLDILDAKRLAGVIENSPELLRIANGELSDSTTNAQTFWNKISSSPVGKDILSKYPDIVKYRISRVDPVKDEYREKSVLEDDPVNKETDPEKKIPISPFEKYDKWSNSTGRNLAKDMPSFADWVNNPGEWNPQQTSGRVSKLSSIGAAR